MDIHLAAILSFDAAGQLRMLTLAQHNHQQTFLAGIDFPQNQKPLLVAAARSNELYLDDGGTSPSAHRVVPLKSFIGDKNDMHATDWNGMVNLMRKRLASAISNQSEGY